MFNIFNKSDSEIKMDVVNELMWDPSVTSTEVKVSAVSGVVTLRGSVPHFVEKMAAEHAAERVGGVKAVADELVVRTVSDKTDQEIAKAAIDALKWSYSVPENVQASVDKGWVTLNGAVDWDYQRNAARDAVSQLMGVIGVTNCMTIKSRVQPSDVKKRIEEALKRSAEAEGRNITVAVDGDSVTLSGNVHSFAEIDDAREAAWNAPGVMEVYNNLTISQ